MASVKISELTAVSQQAVVAQCATDQYWQNNPNGIGGNFIVGGHLGQQFQTVPSTHYPGPTMYSGNRYIVICAGSITELPEGATFEAATEKAESLAHQHQSEAFVLKPVRKVAPKRDVVTTDL